MSLGPDLLLSAGHDLDLTSGDARMEVDLAQAIKINILFVRGEWFLNPSKGLPYRELVWVKQINVDHISAAYRKAIADTPGVQRITQFSVDYDNDNRKLSVSFSVSTAQGEISEVMQVTA